MAYDPSLGKTSEDFRFIFTDREEEKNKQKIRSHLPRTSTPGELYAFYHFIHCLFITGLIKYMGPKRVNLVPSKNLGSK